MKGENAPVEKINKVISFSNKLLMTRYDWQRFITKLNAPIGLPKFLGGIDHPIGLQDGYLESLSIEDKRIIKGVSELDFESSLEFLSQINDDEETATEQTDILTRQLNSMIADYLRSHEFDGEHKFLISEEVPQIPGEWWSATEVRKNEYRKANSLISVYDAHSKITSKLSLSDAIMSRKRKKVTAVASTKRRLYRLRERFQDVEIDQTSNFDISIWNIRQSTVNRAKDLSIPIEVYQVWAQTFALPSTYVVSAKKRKRSEDLSEVTTSSQDNIFDTHTHV